MNDCRDCIQYVYTRKGLFKIRPKCKIDPNIIPYHSIYCSKFEDKNKQEVVVSNIKVRHTYWHECEGSPLEDPEENGTQTSLIFNRRNEWVLVEGCCNSVCDINFCPWCGDKLPTEDELKDI